MPKKPEKPRPSRRYTPPPSADYPLDRLKSASAVVAPPGLGGCPFTLASLFAKPGTDAQAHSFQVVTKNTAAAASYTSVGDVSLPHSPFVASGGGARYRAQA